MKQSFKAFMEEIIDYAGLFPPADLSLDESILKYVGYRKSHEAWMLARFIIPASKLEELAPYRESLFRQGRPFAFSILGTETDTGDEYLQMLNKVMGQIQAFQQDHGSRVTADILEVKLPREAVFASDPGLLGDIYEVTTRNLDSLAIAPDQLFFEAYFEENWRKEIALVLETLGEYNRKSQKVLQAGFKLRCGGDKARWFPSVEQVVFSVNRSRENNIPLKCTAGLHHPIRHYSDPVQTEMHGFINVFGGGMLGYAHDLSDSELQQIIEEEDPEHFSFTDEGFRWKDLEVSTQEIFELRKVALVSFGSCSFDEPREDLRQLALLARSEARGSR